MRQVRLIIIYPQMNASFIRRVATIAESSNAVIEFFPDFNALKAKFTAVQNTTLLLSHESRSQEIRDFANQNRMRVVTWTDPAVAKLEHADEHQWHCIGDPFVSQNHHSAVSLITHQTHDGQWFNQCKWGSIRREFTLSKKNTLKDFKAFLHTLKLNNHPTVALWQKVISGIMDQSADTKTRTLQAICDGNKLKLHYTLGSINKDVLYAQLNAAKSMQDSIIRFECTEGQLIVCCEMQLGFAGQRTPAVIMVGCDAQIATQTKKWEDVG